MMTIPAVSASVANVIPVDVVVPGCPPPPLAILQGILTAVATRNPAPVRGGTSVLRARAGRRSVHRRRTGFART